MGLQAPSDDGGTSLPCKEAQRTEAVRRARSVHEWVQAGVATADWGWCSGAAWVQGGVCWCHRRLRAAWWERGFEKDFEAFNQLHNLITCCLDRVPVQVTDASPSVPGREYLEHQQHCQHAGKSFYPDNPSSGEASPVCVWSDSGEQGYATRLQSIYGEVIRG